MSPFDYLVASCKRRGIQLPPDLDNFSFSDAPLFHSMWIAIFGLGLTESQVEQVVDHAVDFGHDECAATVAEFAVSLLR